MHKKATITLIALFVFTLFVVLFWPTSPYDLSRVHPNLRALKQPYRSVQAATYLDGGSVGVEIIDNDGTKVQAAFPVSFDAPHRHDRLFIGAMHRSYTGAVEVAYTEDTKRFLVDIIAR